MKLVLLSHITKFQELTNLFKPYSNFYKFSKIWMIFLEKFKLNLLQFTNIQTFF